MHAEFVVTQNMLFYLQVHVGFIVTYTSGSFSIQWPPQGLRLLAQATGAASLLQEALAIYTSGKSWGEAFCVILLQ